MYVVAFRAKIRDDALQAKLNTDPQAYEQSIGIAREQATFLKHNIVRGTKSAEDEETWSAFTIS